MKVHCLITAEGVRITPESVAGLTGICIQPGDMSLGTDPLFFYLTVKDNKRKLKSVSQS